MFLLKDSSKSRPCKKIKLVPYKCLTAQAIEWMYLSSLVIRNSHTEQVASLHYKIEGIPEAHSAGAGLYCVPLWTVASPELVDYQFESKRSEGYYKPEVNVIAAQHKKLQFLQTTKTIPALELKNQAYLEHMIKFSQLIKDFIQPYCCFGQYFFGLLDYELLVEANEAGRSFYRYYMDDYGKYPTGGRGRSQFNPETIIFRVKLNSIEKSYTLGIINKKYDDLFPDELSKADVLVQRTVRYKLANQYCADIISAKLIRFLNLQAESRLNKQMCRPLFKGLSKEILDLLLQDSVHSSLPSLKDIINKGLISDLTERDEQAYMASCGFDQAENSHNLQPTQQKDAPQKEKPPHRTSETFDRMWQAQFFLNDRSLLPAITMAFVLVIISYCIAEFSVPEQQHKM